MSVAAPAPATRTRVFALAGNPNCGKTTMFNALTGLRQRVANYPGVTVERKEGTGFGQHGEPVKLIDLPGAYSLNAKSPDEEILRDILLGRRQDIPHLDGIICVVDASNAERHLFLATQILELGIPAIVVLNMTDIAEARGIHFDPEKLSELLGVPVIPMQANARVGYQNLRIALSAAELKTSKFHLALPEELETTLSMQGGRAQLYAPEAAEDHKKEWQAKVIADRYAAVKELVEKSSKRVDPGHRNATERIDQVALNWFAGPLVAIAIMAAVFYLIFSFASIPMDMIDGAFGDLGAWVGDRIPDVPNAGGGEPGPGDLENLLVVGIIGGVGGVVIFLPQILILFFFLGIMEESGYLPRVAFMLDKLMSWVGLSGKAFMPLLSSYACAVPAVMGARTVEHPRDRLITILVAPFGTCTARYPVYLLLIPMLFGLNNPGAQALGLTGMLVLGTLGIFVFAWIFNKLFRREGHSTVIMELPSYKLPTFQSIFTQMWQRGKLFLVRAGTVILALSIVLWALQNYPKVNSPDKAVQLEQSYAGQMGKFIEPVIAPLGYDWKIGIAVIASFAAREVFVSTMNITYHVEEGEDEDVDRAALQNRLLEDKRADGSAVFTPLTCLSLLVFFAFAMQCISTTAIVRRETNSWRWPLFQLGYMTAFAWVAAFVVYQGGKLLGYS